MRQSVVDVVPSAMVAEEEVALVGEGLPSNFKINLKLWNLFKDNETFEPAKQLTRDNVISGVK